MLFTLMNLLKQERRLHPKRNEDREKEDNFEENIFMENKSGPIDIAKQYKTKFEVNDYVVAEHEVEIYETHE